MPLTRYLPFLAWPRLTWSLARTELSAGLTISLLLLPQGIAYAALAGMPLISGIYAALLPALVALLWGASPRLGVGPTALTSLLIGSSLVGLAEPASAQWVALAAWLAIMAGAVQWLLGLLRAGWLLNLVTSPVLSGFTQAAGVLILMSQLPQLLGLRSSWSALWHDPSLHHFDPMAASFGLGALVLLAAAKRYAPRWPAAVLAVAICGALSAWLDFAAADGAVMGHLPQGLPTWALPPAMGWSLLGQLIVPTLVVALISFLEVAASAQIEHRHAGTRWNSNQELVGQGMAKVASGLCGSFAISASFSRSAVTLHTGARSAWATVFAIGVVLLCALWLMPLLYHVPQAVLAAIVVSAVTGLIQPHKLLALVRISRPEGAIALATAITTLSSAPKLYWGVLMGILLSLTLFLYHRLHPRIVEVGLHPDGSLRSREIWDLPALAPDVLALRMDAALDFASAAALELYIQDALSQRPGVRRLFIDAHPINSIDLTGIEAFVRLRYALQKQGIHLHLSGLKLPVEHALLRANALAPNPYLHLHRTHEQALQVLQPAAPCNAL